MQQQYDIIIVGGGPAACAAAIAIRRSVPSVSVLIVEKKQLTHWPLQVGETLPPSTAVVFQQLGLWQSFREQNFMPAYATRSSWGQQELLANEYLFNALGTGWHLNRQHFDLWLIQQAQESGVDYRQGTEVRHTHRLSKHQGNGSATTNCWRLETSDGLNINSKLLIDATGRPAIVAQQQGAERIFHDQLMASYAYFTPTDKSPQQTIDTATWVEAIEGGWWYSAPLPDQRWICALMSDADIQKHRGWRKQRAWRQQIQRSQ